MRNAIFTFSLAIMAAVFASGCKKSCGGELSCDGAICTQEIRSIMLVVRHNDSSLVRLDSTVTTDHRGEIIATGGFSDQGAYLIAGDGSRRRFLNEAEPVTFKGYKSGVLVAEAHFIITADCCHVSKVSGPSEIFVQ